MVIFLPIQNPYNDCGLLVNKSTKMLEPEFSTSLISTIPASRRPRSRVLIMGCFTFIIIFTIILVPSRNIYIAERRKRAEKGLAEALANPPSTKFSEGKEGEQDDDDEMAFPLEEYKGDPDAKVVGALQAKGRNRAMVDTSPMKSSPKFNMPDFAKSHVARFRPDLSHLADAPIKDAYTALVREYLAPWTAMTKKQVGRAPITKRMLHVMEYAYKGGSFRVRISNGKIWYRKIVHWKQTYRTQRMTWYLRLLHEMVRKDRLVKKDVDFIIYVGDGAKVAADTFTTEAGFPLFSLRTSVLHMDIPIPDPVSHGSNGRYLWNDAGKAIPWEARVSQLVFRGKGSCLKMQADNWHVCDRVRAQKLSEAFPEEIDAGIIEWNQLHKASKMIYPPVTVDEVERSTGLKTVKPLDFTQQSHYKYILDLDGGLGSSRKPGILSSGSVLFAQESPWYTYYEPLMEPYKHYVPINRWLHDLRDQVLWARDHDDNMQEMVAVGREFEKKYLTIASTKLYMSILLDHYADLLAEPVNGSEPVERDFCALMDNMEIRNGPMGCSKEWLLFTGGELPDEIKNDGKEE